jgi:hypothetical protein
MGPKGMDCVWWITNAGPFMLGRGMNNTDEDWDVNYMCRLPTLRKHGYGGSSSSLPSANNPPPPPPPPRYWECAPGRAACTREQLGEISRKVCHHHHVGCVGCEHYTVPRERHVARAGWLCQGPHMWGLLQLNDRCCLPACVRAGGVGGAADRAPAAGLPQQHAPRLRRRAPEHTAPGSRSAAAHRLAARVCAAAASGVRHRMIAIMTSMHDVVDHDGCR